MSISNTTEVGGGTDVPTSVLPQSTGTVHQNVGKPSEAHQPAEPHRADHRLQITCPTNCLPLTFHDHGVKSAPARFI